MSYTAVRRVRKNKNQIDMARRDSATEEVETKKVGQIVVLEFTTDSAKTWIVVSNNKNPKIWRFTCTGIIQEITRASEMIVQMKAQKTKESTYNDDTILDNTEKLKNKTKQAKA